MQTLDSIRSLKTAVLSVICLGIITLSGCSSGPTVIPFEQEKLELSGTQPLDLCTWPQLNEGEIDGRTVIYMEVSEFSLQAACQEVERANYTIAAENAGAVEEAVGAFNALIDKAELHNTYAQNELDREFDERKGAEREALTYQGLLALVLIIVAL